MNADPLVADVDMQSGLTVNAVRDLAAQHSIESAALDRTEGSAAEEAARASAHAGHPESGRAAEDPA